MARIWRGAPLGFENGRALENPGPAPTCILGVPGSGKTTDVTCNFLLDEPGKQSFIVIDTKGTVSAITGDYRRKVCGANNVKNINPENLLGIKSDKWNPAKPLKPEAADFEDRAQLLSSTVIPDTNPHQTHFALAARSAWTAGTIVNVKAAATLGRAGSLPEVRDMWTQEPDKLRALVKTLMKSGDPAVTNRVSKFLDDTDELSNIKSTIEAATSWMTAAMRRDMETNYGVDFGACRDQPTTIYATLATESLVDKDVFFRLVLGAALADLYKKPGLKTTIIIEEGFACGRLEILEKAFATARELDIDIVIVFQFVSQIKQLYPASWKQFLSGAVLAYRAGDGDTAEWMAERAGTEQVLTASASDPSGPHEFGRPRPNYGLQRQQRIPAGQMYAMPKGMALAWLPGDDAPRLVTMRGYFHRKLRKLGRRAKPNPYFRGKATVRRPIMRAGLLLAAVAIGGAMMPRVIGEHDLPSAMARVLRTYAGPHASASHNISKQRWKRP